MPKYKIGISGSYGGLNMGDEAILTVILQDIRRNIDADLVVFSANPEDTQRRHKVRAIPIREMHKDAVCKELCQLDLFILGGGGILFEGMADIFLRDVNWAKECDIPVFVFAISVGPVVTPETKKLVAETLNKVDRITVREPEAKKILNDLGVEKSIDVTADPALLVVPQRFTREMLGKQGFANHKQEPLIGFSAREPGGAASEVNVEKYHEILANAADFMVERFKAQIIFIPMERREHKDLQHSHAVISKMLNAQSAQVLKEEFSPGHILGLTKHMQFAVGMRLHFLIFCAIHNVPFVALPYAAKVRGFLTELGLPMPPMKQINAGKLCAFLDSFWDRRSDMREQLKERVPQLQEKARMNFTKLYEFLPTLKRRSVLE